MEGLKNKNVLVYGAGKSGISAVRLLCKSGATAWLWDNAFNDENCQICNDAKTQLLGLNCVFLKAKEDIPYNIIEFAIINPAVPPFKMPIPVISELEFASTFIKKPIIAITGTNGKTTVTKTIGHILGVEQYGNIGTPLSDFNNEKYCVCEVSSFQLETCTNFKPKISVILNIEQDHLDRHNTMEEYSAIKASIFKNQKRKEFTVLNYDCIRTRELAKKAKCRVMFFSTQYRVSGVYVSDGIIYFNKKQLFSIKELNFVGEHNLSNFLASILICCLLGIKTKNILEKCKTFVAEKHRLELVSTVQGIDFYNDSKATNIASVMAAVNSFGNRDIRLIIGGITKGQEFSNFLSNLPKTVKTIVVIGEARQIFTKLAVQDGCEFLHLADSLQRAVDICYENALYSDVVLLSPACSSFDMFKNYKHRGEVFVDACNRIKENQKDQ
ncbi:MAG: UDP-N-acetylmuramoyl-L-alanine--D-glutamate ligase [Firmicutes bacterium]|nr:UDP-N-acetylmuramoyl-L-alanine--D-glutamate ligase [Bacillota bacterium]